MVWLASAVVPEHPPSASSDINVTAIPAPTLTTSSMPPGTAAALERPRSHRDRRTVIR